MFRKIFAFFMAVCISFLCTQSAVHAENEPVLCFGEDSIAETVSGSGYSIDGTVLMISASGVYRISGECSEGSVVVSKGLSDVVLILDDLTLSSSSTAPIVIKKESSVTIHLDGSNTLNDNEDPSEEETNEDFEGACIKVKSNSSLTFCGEGSLSVNGNAKNAIKGAAESSLVFNDGTYAVHALNNGIAADHSVTINDGSFAIYTDNDGIKSVPDAEDTASSGDITINGGTFEIYSNGDAIQAETKLEINYGEFNIQTMEGSDDSSFDKDTMSAKGIKASGDREDIENQIVINGGNFRLNTADDAIHSDACAEINAGTFNIWTGDDGVHADTSLTLGTEGGYERDPMITIHDSYEGLEAGTLNIYSGKYWVVASDDGINAAGGSSNGSDPGMPDPFRPGGPGSGSSGEYSLNIHGGNIYVDALGDGLDANGDLNLNGGNITVFSMQRGGDNSPLDSDGTITIKDAKVFAAGSNPMNERPSSGSKYYENKSSLSAGIVVNVKSGNTVLYSDTLLRNVNYILYADPVLTSSPTFVSGGNVDIHNSHAWAHPWDKGYYTAEATEDAPGTILYSCNDCGSTERQSYWIQKDCSCDGHEAESQQTEDEGYQVNFVCDEGASVNVYYTQDYSAADETNVISTVSRNSDTGKPDSTGSGQVNFTVITEEGYSVSDIQIEGTYKNLKSPDDTGLANTYRITKIGSELTVTITLLQESSDVFRIAGSGRFQTSMKIADAYKEEKGIDKFDNVILTSGLNFADALAGSYLSYKKNAPILITADSFGDSKPYEEINAYIKENLEEGGTVYVLGGTGAVSDTALTGLENIKVERVKGASRFETNIEILKEAGVKDEEILVATGYNFADSLSASAVNRPILLVGDELNSDQLAYLDTLETEKFYILGGTGAVKEAVETQLKEYGSVTRLAGKGRHETSVLIAETFCNNADRAVLAYSFNFPDGLCAGPLASAINAPLILTTTGEEVAAAEFCNERDIHGGYVTGGTTLISDDSAKIIFNTSGVIQLK